MEDAIRQALASPNGSLGRIASNHYNALTPKGYLKVCPFCQKKDQTFCVKKSTAGHWYWGCHSASCQVNIETLKSNRTADTIGFIMVHEGVDRKAAVDRLLSIAGIPNPREDSFQARKRAIRSKAHPKPQDKAEPAPPPATNTLPTHVQHDDGTSPSSLENQDNIPGLGPVAPPGETQPPIEKAAIDKNPTKSKASTKKEKPKDNIIPFSLHSAEDEEGPDEPQEPTVWDAIWKRLSLTPEHRENLKRKRGFNKETIDALGYRSSILDNKTILQPILSEFPIEILLSEGIFFKDPRSGEFKLNRQLHGEGIVKRGSGKEKDEWGWTNPVLIPYFNRHGRITALRPHKGGLSGGKFMREQGYEIGFRSTRTRTHPYATPLLWQRSEEWYDTCVLTEGEFKGGALHQTGIPSVATPGIQMLRNEHFLKELASILRSAGIRNVIVVYDNEDKSHKPDIWTRYEAEVYAYFACHALRGEGFYTSHAMLPDEWRVDGKADWDGALCMHAKSADEKFRAVLKNAAPYFGQMELFGTRERDRVIHCKLNRLTHVPTILTGGEEEERLARLIQKTPKEYRAYFRIREMTAELFETRGCYYVRKTLPDKMLKVFLAARSEIRKKLGSTPVIELETVAGLEAALAAVNHIIAGRPEILSDFTISCEFQLRTATGEVKKLFQFRNKHGQVSKHVAVPSSASSGAQKFREFAMSIGNFNPMLGDKHLQQLMIELGKFSAWREIRELEMIGEDPESKLWFFGDCAFAPDGSVYFADDHDIIWHDGIGYRIDPASLRKFAHETPPKFFQKLGMSPTEVLAELKADPTKELVEVAKIFIQLCADMIYTFGSSSGILAIGIILGYAMAPELLRKYNGHPGLWLHGRAFSGKTEQTRFFMMMWGYDPGYRTATLSAGTTSVAIDRLLAQYSNIPLHLDEFRQDEVDKNRMSSLRVPFNRQSKQKGQLDQTNKTRSVQPMTSPIVTGEGVTGDSATLSRYVEIVLSAANRMGTKDQQLARYRRMLRESSHYHRIIRWVMMNRAWFAEEGIKTLDQFLEDNEVIEAISSDRIRLSYGASYSAFRVLFKRMSEVLVTAQESGTIGEFPMFKQDLSMISEKLEIKGDIDPLKHFTLSFARDATADVAQVNFVVKFWESVMTSFIRSQSDIKNFIWFEWCKIDPQTNHVSRTNAKKDTEGLVRCVLVQANPLYAAYEVDTRARGHNPDLTLQNIRSECQNERYWVPAPKGKANRAHRLSFEKGQINVWVLRVDRMEPALANVFNDRFEFDEPEDTLHF